jgi:hypothetical protein
VGGSEGCEGAGAGAALTAGRGRVQQLEGSLANAQLPWTEGMQVARGAHLAWTLLSRAAWQVITDVERNAARAGCSLARLHAGAGKGRSATTGLVQVALYVVFMSPWEPNLRLCAGLGSARSGLYES